MARRRDRERRQNACRKQPSAHRRPRLAPLNCRNRIELGSSAKSGDYALPCPTAAMGALALQNLQIDGQRLWDSLMATARIGATPQGRHLPADLDRSRPSGARLVQGAMRGARLHRHGRRHGQHVRAPARQEPRAPADRHGLASRHPADRRQIRRRAWRPCRAGSAAHAARPRLRDQCADRDRQLDQRRRRALCAGDAGLGGLRRRVLARLRL